MSSADESSWIEWYCNLPGNEFYCQVDECYIKDLFNLTGLSEQVPNYRDTLRLILDYETGYYDCDNEIIDINAEKLYGLIHARYILTNVGIIKMIEKYKIGKFGRCPRVRCESQRLLPLGLSDIPGEAMVKTYCPKCIDVYNPESMKKQKRQIDGAYFGTGFPHMLFMVQPEFRPKRTLSDIGPSLSGFKMHSLSADIGPSHNKTEIYK